MCGIAGLVAFSAPLDEGLLARMAEDLAHRGPDQGGTFVERREGRSVGLAARRLKIIDLSPAGDQPMGNATGDVWIAYNGEVYNHTQLAGELVAAGYAYRSRTDTETVLHAYEHYGLDLLPRLNGMFAFALYDRRAGRLVLARDRMGIKPLYYWWDGATFALASELKALLLCPWIDRAVDREALDFYIGLGYVPSPRTLVQGVRKLVPGSCLVLDLARRTVTEQRFWPPEQIGAALGELSDPALVAETRRVLDAAVARQLMSDVPVGALLSGGLDSTIVTTLAQRLTGRRLDTFAVGHEAPSGTPESLDRAYNDDLRYARLVATRLGTRHHEVLVPVGRELADLIATMVYQLDEPVSEATAVPQHLVARLAREAGVIVLLTGDGGDELFAGYPWYREARKLARYERIPGLAHALPFIERFVPSRAVRFKAGHLSQRLHASDVAKYCHFFNVPSPGERQRLLAAAARLDGKGALIEQAVGAALQRFDGAAFADKLAWIDLTWWIRDIFNHRLDRTTMLNSVEARVPFQDDDVVDFALSVPSARKMPRGRPKHLLIEAFEDLLPAEVQTRVKRPFVSPFASWLRAGLRDFALDALAPPELARAGVLDPASARAIAERYCLAGEGDPLFVWRLLMLQLWCRAYGVSLGDAALAGATGRTPTYDGLAAEEL